tara:strand:+ start:866 stop:1702 length:837 start_codon:yes stop_codon:yes gene_type:complete
MAAYDFQDISFGYGLGNFSCQNSTWKTNPLNGNESMWGNSLPGNIIFDKPKTKSSQDSKLIEKESSEIRTEYSKLIRVIHEENFKELNKIEKEKSILKSHIREMGDFSEGKYISMSPSLVCYGIDLDYATKMVEYVSIKYQKYSYTQLMKKIKDLQKKIYSKLCDHPLRDITENIIELSQKTTCMTFGICTLMTSILTDIYDVIETLDKDIYEEEYLEMDIVFKMDNICKSIVEWIIPFAKSKNMTLNKSCKKPIVVDIEFLMKTKDQLKHSSKVSFD